MGYVLQAFIAEEPVLISLASGLTHARLVPLGYGLAMIPLTEALFDEMNQTAIASGISATPGRSWYYPEGVAWAVEWSAQGLIAYVEADFFGGVGYQHSVVCRGGGIILGPIHSGDDQP